MTTSQEATPTPPTTPTTTPTPTTTKSPGTNFYEWVNHAWLDKAKIPAKEGDFGVSEEVESCVNSKALDILKEIQDNPQGKDEEALSNLTASCLHSAVQQNSVEFLKLCLAQIGCIETSEDVVKEFAKLAKYQKAGMFKIDTYVDEHKVVHLELYPNASALKRVFYSDIDKLYHYKAFLKRVGQEFKIEKLDSVIHFEKTVQDATDNCWRGDDAVMKGSQLLHKFPKFPWSVFFQTLGLDSWKTIRVYTPTPSFFRWFSTLLEKVPLSFWKLYLSKVYIVESLQYLPPPYDELQFDFFGKQLLGNTQKTPQSDLLLHIVYNRCSDIFSKIFWDHAGDEKLLVHSKQFSKNLLQAAKHRVSKVDWMKGSTKTAAVEKIDNMMFSFIRPDHWATTRPLELESKCLLKNVFTLGEWNTTNLFDRIGKPYKFWEEGIFRVNAYYYNSKNQIMIPYATVISPFYSKDAPLGWNYGALGSIIGHEMCHGFDEDGRLYWKNGKKKNWWARADTIAYNKKAKALVKLFSEEEVHGQKVNGSLTLDENIADLGGLGIALEALKDHMRQEGIQDTETVQKAYRTFFCAFATSWRTKFRKQKLSYALKTDKHAPAFLRVNMIVRHFPEWYEVFEVTDKDSMFLEESKRIRIF
jgi:putative endopeptidase